MYLRAILVAIFVPLFGFIFIWAGIRRILSPPPNDKPGESIFWGSVGIGLGVGIFGFIVWLFLHPPENPPDFPTGPNSLIQSRSHEAPSLIDTPTTQPVQ